MKLYKLLLPLLLLVLPIKAYAMPGFPMAFWGNVTLNGTPAPVGTVVNAYYGTTLAGTVTVSEAGIYGYTDATKQKLVINEGTGAITFTVQQTDFNSGSETGGTVPQTYTGFTAGETDNVNLAFQTAVIVPSSGGGGGGGGGGGSSSATVTTSIPAVTTTPSTSTTPSYDIGCLVGNKFSSTTGVACTSANTNPQAVANAPAPAGQVLGATSFHFTLTLKQGAKGDEVTQLQNRLNADGYSVGIADGKFGAKTRTALMKWQLAHHLTADGIAGAKTRAVLNQ